jgi:uncharacterized sulfatase
MVGQKGMLAEGGIRVPFVAAWPGHWPAGATYDQPVINLDVAATAVAAAGLPHDDKLDGVDLSSFVTGENKSAPHDALYWRWASQAAVLEMPYKLIKLGSRPPLLFDLTRPEGENLERNLAAQRPEIVSRLEQRLRAWAAELQPPGLSEDASGFSRHHEELFAGHRITAATSASRPRPEPAEGSVQGWIARNGMLAVKDGALLLTPDADLPKNARPFVTNSHLDLAGPVTVTLRVRAKESGKGPASITWRTKQDSFAAHQSATFDWPAGIEWREVRVPLSEKSRIIHIRINPPKGATGIEIQSIKLKGGSDAPCAFRFDSKQ